MASDHSFDMVSKIDLQELDNAINQASREIETRYDLKDSKSSLTLNKTENKINIATASELTLKSIMDILRQKMIKRNLSPKALTMKPVEKATHDTVRQTIEIQQGIPQEKAKEIVKDIKATNLKLQTQIQNDQIRVTAKKIDDLQAVMAIIKEKDYAINIQFTNYR